MQPCVCHRLCVPCVQTTLLNHILTGDHGRRIAVIENEVRLQDALQARQPKD